MARKSSSKKPPASRVRKSEDYLITNEPYYEPIDKEIVIFEAAYRLRKVAFHAAHGLAVETAAHHGLVP